MRSFTCPNCHSITQLPDDWEHPGFKCPQCHQGVTIIRPQPHYHQRDDYDYEDRRPREVHYKNKTGAGKTASAGFFGAFGGCFGIIAAFILVGIGCIFLIGSCTNEVVENIQDNNINDTISKLDHKQRLAQQFGSSLSVSGTKFIWDNSNRFSSEPVIEFTLKNNSKRPITRVYFDGLVTSPNRTVPWVKESFNHEIVGGLEPGEERTFRLIPNSFTDWGDAPKDRDDLKLSLTLVKAETVGGQVIYDGPFTQADADRLNELRSRKK